jgi:hypothetical protein
MIKFVEGNMVMMENGNQVSVGKSYCILVRGLF